MNSFNQLLCQIKPYMKQRSFDRAQRNGPIYHSTRLACTLCFIAGGPVYDISKTFGVLVYKNIWKVVKAVNTCPDHNINFSKSHKEQQKIANDFHRKLGA